MSLARRGLAVLKPTKVAIADSTRIGLQVAKEEDVTPFVEYGLQPPEDDQRLFSSKTPTRREFSV